MDTFDLRSKDSSGAIFGYALAYQQKSMDFQEWGKSVFPHSGLGLADCTIEGLELKSSSSWYEKSNLSNGRILEDEDHNSDKLSQESTDLPVHLMLAKNEMSVEKLELSTTVNNCMGV